MSDNDAQEQEAYDLLARRFRPVFDAIAAGARDRERTGELPREHVRALADAGFGAVRIPRRFGGAGATLTDLFRLLVELGQADSNFPQIWRNHLAFVEDRLRPGTETYDLGWFDRLVAGDIVGGAWTEASPSAPLTSIATTLSIVDDGWVLNGAKGYSTGSLFAQWIGVLASTPDEKLVLAFVPSPRNGIELSDDWDGFGQRQTASGTSRFVDVPVQAAHVYPFDQRARYQNAFYQLVHLANLVGIGRAARDELVSEVTNRARGYPHGLAARPVDDEQVQQVVGRVAALVFAAESAVTAAARLLHRASEGDDGLSHDESALIASDIATYSAQIIAGDSVLEATTVLFDALGSSGVSAAKGLDRHWRNARTIASHNPRIYKERIVGDWYLRGTNPLAAINGRPRREQE